MPKSTARAPNHLYRRGRNYAYRRRVPDDVRAVGAFGGKEHYHTSLGTSDISEARRQAAAISDWFEAEVRRARGHPPSTPLTEPAAVMRSAVREDEVACIAAEWWKMGAERDFRERMAARQDDLSAEALDRQDDQVHHIVASFNHELRGAEWRRKYVENDIYPLIDRFVSDVCARHRIAKGSAGYAMVREAVAEAEVDVLMTRFQRRDGSPFDEVRSPLIEKGLAAPAARAHSSWSLRELADHVLKHQQRSASWHEKVDTTVRLFEDFLGGPRAIADIQRSDVRSFLETLGRCPVRASMRFPGKGIKDAADLNDTRRPPYPRIKPNTIRDTHFAALRWLFVYADDSLNALKINPTNRLSIAGAVKRGGGRAVFSDDELNALLRLPVFAGCKSSDRPGLPGSVLLDDHRFWAPLMMLFTGARPSELAQLSIGDVKLDASHPYISILTEYDEDDPTAKPHVVSFKTKNARRDVPIHPELTRLGFTEFVNRVASEKHERLFPRWKLSSDPRKLYSQASWIRMLNGVYIPKISRRHPKPTIYSLRHTCKTRMVACGIPPQYQNQILGHAMTGMDGHYYTGASIEELATALGRLSYPRLSLDHLVRCGPT